MKRHKLPYLEYQVLVGKKAKTPCRLVIYQVDRSIYEKRIGKTSKQAKSCGYQVSE